jgi:hypothetical protein
VIGVGVGGRAAGHFINLAGSVSASSTLCRWSRPRTLRRRRPFKIDHVDGPGVRGRCPDARPGTLGGERPLVRLTTRGAPPGGSQICAGVAGYSRCVGSPRRCRPVVGERRSNDLVLDDLWSMWRASRSGTVGGRTTAIARAGRSCVRPMARERMTGRRRSTPICANAGGLRASIAGIEPAACRSCSGPSR